MGGDGKRSFTPKKKCVCGGAGRKCLSHAEGGGGGGTKRLNMGT